MKKVLRIVSKLFHWAVFILRFSQKEKSRQRDFSGAISMNILGMDKDGHPTLNGKPISFDTSPNLFRYEAKADGTMEIKCPKCGSPTLQTDPICCAYWLECYWTWNNR